ncbi:hypothetical protein P280DRAFT_466474 [Massarina eburnea CBS 473.64]|uniref:Rhodopsin domain-containing protein n=1 Tax=Massarina eburnea CBS 473.64 TaxID=1395130 RepID=A0A6A6SAG1_9PLEO|nr:hypothetical protein P280DRAFT_466474 [Massarina eburnea CBS 473.64]
MSTLEPESGIWYAICWLATVTRLLSRRLHAGSWSGLRLDDYLICVAMGTLTVLMSVMHFVVKTSSNLIEPGQDVSRFSQHEIASRIYGSKLVVVVEQMQCCTIWLVKACLLLMYWRLTALLPQHRVVLLVSIYTFFGFVIMEVLYLGVWCRPFYQYWAVPTSPQCSAATNHLITNAVLNISSDLMIISLPMPLLFRVQVPLKKKLILGGIFMVGAFTIVSAVLNKYYSFTHPFGSEWTQWYLREAYTAVICANLPFTYPFIQRVFNLKSWSHNSYHDRYLSGTRIRHSTRTELRYQRKSNVGPKEGISKTVSVDVRNSYNGNLHRSESEERINLPSVPSIPSVHTKGEFGQSSWVSGGMELDEISPTLSSKGDGSMNSRSLKSLEESRTKH